MTSQSMTSTASSLRIQPSRRCKIPAATSKAARAPRPSRQQGKDVFLLRPDKPANQLPRPPRLSKRLATETPDPIPQRRTRPQSEFKIQVSTPHESGPKSPVDVEPKRDGQNRCLRKTPATPRRRPASNVGNSGQSDALGVARDSSRPKIQLNTDRIRRIPTRPPLHHPITSSNGAVSVQPISGGKLDRELLPRRSRETKAVSSSIVATGVDNLPEATASDSNDIVGEGRGDGGTRIAERTFIVPVDKLHETKNPSPAPGICGSPTAQTSQMRIVVPEGHKLVHVMRHCRAWHNLEPRGIENLSQIHDPGLTPGGIKDAKLFTVLYPNLRKPTIIVSSPLRRCLQTAIHAFGSQIKSRELRVVANPDLQEVSTSLCDTGTPLDVLREEFPDVEFPDNVFPEIWPRIRNKIPPKDGTIYADVDQALLRREERIRDWIRALDDMEVIVITHGDFAHFIFDCWAGEPGNSVSYGTQLLNGQAQAMTLPNKSLPPAKFQPCGTLMHIAPDYPAEGIWEDESPEVYLDGVRDCGIFTPSELKH